MNTARTDCPSRKRALAILAVACVTAVIAALGSSTASSSVGAARVICGTFTGPAWKSLPYRGVRKGTVYMVSADKVSCAFAKSWSAKLARKPSQGARTTLPGPAGWECFVDARVVGFVRGLALAGECDKGHWTPRHTNPVFLWLPKEY
jgi:hypothetical protein